MSRLLLATILLFLLQSCSQDPQGEQQVSEGSLAQVGSASNMLLAALPADNDPDSKTFQTLDGRGFDIDLFAGQKVFVNFWATWCAPCIREIPSINRAATELEEEGYTFLFVSDEDPETINDFLLERQFPGNFVKLNGYFASFGIGAVPSSWLVDENGDVEAVWAGAYEWDSEEMLNDIRNPSSPAL